MGDLEKLTSYFLVIGQKDDNEPFVSCTHQKRMSVFVDRVDERIVSPHPMSRLFKGVEGLKLEGNGCKGIIELLRRDGFGNTKSLQISGLDNLEMIYDDPPPVELFSKLEYLSLSGLNTLMYLWKYPNQKFSLSNLKNVKIRRCRNLKWVFPLSIAESLCQLESIEVVNCPMMEEVFKDEKESETSSVATINHLKFPNLKTIILYGLPMLGALCNAVDAVIECPSMEKLYVEVSLQLEQVKCTKLKVLIMRKLGIEIFYSEVPFGFFSELEELEIISFHSLRTLCSTAVLGDLINLRIVTVRDCMMLEDIVKIEDVETIVGSSSSVVPIFSRLFQLILSELPKIRYFCPLVSNALEFPSLEIVTIKYCPMMKTFVGDQHVSNSSSGSIPARHFFGKQVTCPKLKDLTLEGLKVSGGLFSPEIPIAHLNALWWLQIKSCHNLNNLFTYRMFGGLTSLEVLEVRNCSMLECLMMEEVFKDEKESENSVTTINHLKFPNLKTIKLDGLPMLGALCNAVDAVIIECPYIKELDIHEVSLRKRFGSHLNQVKCIKLKELRMRKLDIEIFYSEVPFGFFSELKELQIISFQSLRILFSSAVFGDFINMRRLIVRDCMMLEDIVKIEESETIVGKSSSVLPLFSRLFELELSKLPKISYFCPLISNALEFPSLENVTIEDCEMMETFTGYRHANSSGSIPTRPFFDKQVTCPKLRNLTLKGLKVSGGLFSPEISIAHVNALKWLRIERCHNLNNLFTSRMFGDLTSLMVKNCSMLEKVIGKMQDEADVDDEDELVVMSLPELRVLILSELPKLREFSHHHLELPSLLRISIENCSEIMKSRSFCVGGGCVHMPTGVRVNGISDPEFASQFFFHTQHHRGEEDSLNNGSFILLSTDLSYIWDSKNAEPSLVKGSSDGFFLDGWKEVCGKFNMEKLSPAITYEIVFAAMLVPPWPRNSPLETILGDDKRKHEVKFMPMKQWTEILAGEFRPSSSQCGEIAFSLQKGSWGTCVAVKGVIIRPKENVA